MQVTPFYRHSFNAVEQHSHGGYGRRHDVQLCQHRHDRFIRRRCHGRSRERQSPLSGFIGGTAYHQKTDAGNLDPLLSASTFGWSVRTNGAFRVSRTIDAQALVSYVGRTTIVEGWNAAQTRVSFGIRDKLMADRLSLTMRIIDPFSTARQRSATLDPSFTQLNNRLRPIRALQLSATWMFGRHGKKDDQIDLSTGGQ